MNDKSNKQLSILLIDDEPFILDLTTRILKKLGYENLSTAADGQSALIRLVTSDKNPDLIICDMNMPGMDGIEFMRRANEARFDGGFILLSGEDQRILESAFEFATAYDLNMLGVLVKPLKPEPMEQLIGKLHTDHAKNPNIPPHISISEQEFRRGIRNAESEQLVLLVLPKIDMASRKITGVEAMMGWRGVDNKIYGPENFVPLAIELGLYRELSERIYRKAGEQTAIWLAAGLDIKTTVKFSVDFFVDPEFPDFIFSSTKEMNVDPSRIILEVTEGEVVLNSVSCLEAMMRFRMRKFGLSIDDFGSGHTTIAQLTSLPFTEVKINHAFDKGAIDNARARGVLDACVALAKHLQMTIVASGAVGESDWELAEQLGVDYIEGPYCSPPLTVDEFQEFQAGWVGPH